MACLMENEVIMSRIPSIKSHLEVVFLIFAIARLHCQYLSLFSRVPVIVQMSALKRL